MLSPADDAFATRLAEAVPGLRIGAPEPRHLEEPRGRYHGLGGLLVRPRSTQEVAAIVALCHADRVAIVPYGGGTGLVGGQILESGPPPVLLSLEALRSVRAVTRHVLEIEAGASLQDAHDAADAEGRLFPLTIASQGSAQIGGVLATNAGGVNVLRYGNARELCLGVEAVLADGTVISGLKHLRKDNTGYDLKDLLIGSEGSLGIITAATLRLHPRPATQGTAMMVVRDPAAALSLLELAEARMPGCISAFELISGQGLGFLRDVGPEVHQPFAEPPEWMVLTEIGLPDGIAPEEALTDLFEAAGELVQDGVIASSQGQRNQMWTLRESLPEANKRIGSISSHDISLPLPKLAEFIDTARARIAALGDMRINCFGHVGDGNLHFNVFPAKGRERSEYEALRKDVAALVYDLVDTFGGSISAEHGIGRLKVADLVHYGDPGKLAAMRAIKAALDPEGILNPGAVLAAQ
ncbi:2-hydroxyacid dehydrogenase [Thioclava dalianensis]|uniref:2-hydroxyacid dehydrogenase n=1 Tax=Thioclava dalianensis TaxID=1185766 RepID=A0A074TBE0_9RHOB|nr:FAD-binding oxidoreductase [Thioclava dalianensis]KEP69029.1 2-hydroxyacid dehydrogenase [Thioclava dalianensis]SFM88937.1 FAD/FMN-containing dehydrogenase [Thioclava dalianensis]